MYASFSSELSQTHVQVIHLSMCSHMSEHRFTEYVCMSHSLAVMRNKPHRAPRTCRTHTNPSRMPLLQSSGDQTRLTLVCSFLSCLTRVRLSRSLPLSSRSCPTTSEVWAIQLLMALSRLRWPFIIYKTDDTTYRNKVTAC